MVQGYYTLQEAAKFLGISVDELKQIAQKGKIRSFQDRGTLRFRIQDIQEKARERSGASDPDQILGDASLPPPKSGPKPSSGAKKPPSSPKVPVKKQDVPDVFDFDMGSDDVDLGAEIVSPKSGPKSKPSSKGTKKVPPPGSDSDVRLVADGSDVTFSLPKESEIKLADSDVKISPDPLKPKTNLQPSSGSKRASQLALGSGAQPKSKPGGPSSAAKQTSPRPGSGPLPVDSGVRLVPMDSDSDVKLVGASDDVPLGGMMGSSTTDSNVRLERVSLPPADSQEGNMMLTEEINLDEEIRKQENKEEKPTRLKPKSELKFATTSPFELSDSDLKMPSELQDEAGGPKTPVRTADADSSDFDLTAQSPTEDGSSDFDLVPAEDGRVLMEQGESSDFSLEVNNSSEQVLDQEVATELTSSTSGISLDNPADEGISLEGGENENASDFDLSLEVEDTPKPAKSLPADDSDSEFELTIEKTPKPKKSKPAEDSSEFELTLDSDADAPVSQEGSESSEFDLSLEENEGGMTTDSDAEFELTLDDSGNLAVGDEEKPQVKSKKKGDASEEDIFETDFEVPALDESADAATADSELESSDFDLALDDSDLAAEDESGSQVVALDEDESATLDDSSDTDAVVDDVEVEEESSDFAQLDEDIQVDDEDAVDVDAEAEAEAETAAVGKTVIKEKLIPAAPWGVMPVIFMLPCVIIMFLVGILGYELVQSTAGLKPPGPLTLAVADMLGQKLTIK